MNRGLLESERLLLKPLTNRELSFINSGDVNKIDTLIEQEVIFDSVKVAISKKLEKMKNLDEGLHEWYTYWLIINKSNQKGIGFVGFKGVPDETGYSEVGYSISYNYRKKRFMTEALLTLIKWASSFKNCKGIAATRVLKDNVGSNNVLNNCNFKLISSTGKENNYVLKL